MVQNKTILNDIKNNWRGSYLMKIKNKGFKIIREKDLDKIYCDAIVILTDWEEFKKLNWSKLNKKIRIFDGRNLLKKSQTIYQIGTGF